MTSASGSPVHHRVRWRAGSVVAPDTSHPVPVVVADGVPYVPDAHRFQRLDVYLPRTPETTGLVGRPAVGFPDDPPGTEEPTHLVHVHGGAWRDPRLTARSIEATVAHAFGDQGAPHPIRAIASLDYTLSPFPSHPTDPHDPADDHPADPAREARYPAHLADVLHGLTFLASWGLAESGYLLSGHSAGACLALQATLVAPEHHGLTEVERPPRPAAVLGLNGLYDLPDLVDGLDPPHAHLRAEYRDLISHAYGPDPTIWPAASPTRFDPDEIAAQRRHGSAPELVLLDQSAEDQLVPMNQKARLDRTLRRVPGLRVLDGHRCTGSHAAPWEQGSMIWHNVRDVLEALR